jgi:tetratricopeptide (TPR) repeat protein
VPEAISEFEQAIRLARESGNQQVECGTLGNLGWLYQQIGQPEKALDHYLAAAAATRPGRTIYQDGLLQANLASLYLELGRFEDAVATATIAISLNEESGSRVEQANAHRSLGDALTATGRSDEARSQRRAALAIYRDLGDPQADEVAAKLA